MTPADVVFWLTPWEPSILLPVATIVTAATYLRGTFRVPPPFFHQAAFWLGLVTFYIALQTGFDYFAEHLFWVHRLQHVLVHHLAPLLIILAQPGEVLRAGLPQGLRRLGSALRLRRLPAWLTGPVTAPLLFTALTVLWLIPPVQDAAMLSPWLYEAMNLTLVVNGLMFWQACLFGPAPIPGRIAMAVSIIPVQVVAGLLLVFADGDLYPVFDLCGRVPGMTAQTDQALGGAIVWLSGAMMSVPAVIALALQAGSDRAAGKGSRISFLSPRS